MRKLRGKILIKLHKANLGLEIAFRSFEYKNLPDIKWQLYIPWPELIDSKGVQKGFENMTG